MVSNSSGLTFKESHIEGWAVPTIEFSEPAGSLLRVAVRGVIINSAVTGKRQYKWKVKIASAIREKRGAYQCCASDEYAISLTMRFHLDTHGGNKLDADNFVKPILDAIAAGLFSSSNPSISESWDFPDYNFKTLLIHRLPDAETCCDEGIAVCVSVRSGTAADAP